MKIIIVGHKGRIEWVSKLQQHFPGSCAYVDHSNKGALHGHLQALHIAEAANERCVIMEDDAIPVWGFDRLAQSWINRFPSAMISFYLGTSRPPQWQSRIDNLLAVTEEDFITLPTLIHAVCYTLPPEQVPRVIDQMAGTPEADFAIGKGWGRPVIYPVESLVEHRDGLPVERHPDGQPRTEPRVARQLAAPLAYDR